MTHSSQKRNYKNLIPKSLTLILKKSLIKKKLAMNNKKKIHPMMIPKNHGVLVPIVHLSFLNKSNNMIICVKSVANTSVSIVDVNSTNKWIVMATESSNRATSFSHNFVRVQNLSNVLIVKYGYKGN
jgi:hypothetical protein